MTSEVHIWSGSPSQIHNIGTYVMCGLGNVVIVSNDATTPASTIPAIANGSELREQWRMPR